MFIITENSIRICNLTMSHLQSVAYNVANATQNFENIKSKLAEPGTYCVVFCGSVVYYTEKGKPGWKADSIMLPTTTKVTAFLDCRYISAISAGKTQFYIINGANDSGGESGTTYTTSEWANQHNVRLYKGSITVKCFGLAPHETCDMSAIWMEEHGHNFTETFIVGKTAKERRERLVELAETADETVITEGGLGTLDEITMLRERAPDVFKEKTFVVNGMFLIDTLLTMELKKLSDSDTGKREAYEYFQTHLPSISI